MLRQYNDPLQKERRRELRTAQTEAEKLLWLHLKNKQLDGHKFYRQFGIGSYIADFYCPKIRLVVELDGGQHSEDENVAYDQIRTDYFTSLGIKVIRFGNTDVLKNIEGTIEEIRGNITPPAPLASRGEPNPTLRG